MRKTITCLLLSVMAATCLQSQSFETRFEKTNGKETANYFQIIDYYRQLDQAFPNMKLMEMGTTDAGYPLHLVIITNGGDFNPASWEKNNKVVFMINNGIHPGEPDGIDASMMICRDLLQKKIKLPSNVVLAVIPVYNIGGCLNRNRYSRVNQNGPDTFGFRGNSQNLDLNRDFTKCDSKEAISFARIFHYLDPDVFLDTHVSDGADFQHTMTLITTQYDKLGSQQGEYLKKVLEPSIYSGMKKKNWDLIPYVDFSNDDFKKGITMFYDPPRYSSGYASLFHCYSFISETHMLKPYSLRVQSTYDLIKQMIQTLSVHSTDLLFHRRQSRSTEHSDSVALSWAPSTVKKDSFLFKGYGMKEEISNATGLAIKRYDHHLPFEQFVPFYNFYKPVKKAKIPKAYCLSQAWQPVVRILEANGVKMRQFRSDSTIHATTYHINYYKSYQQPYEKHHKNFSVAVEPSQISIEMRKGDYIIETNQPNSQFIAYMLEPESEDGFFAWNFFDGILQQKEWYSDYRWDSLAADWLQKDTALKSELEEKKKNDSKFASDAAAILNYIYRRSPYQEPEYKRYPVFRIEYQ